MAASEPFSGASSDFQFIERAEFSELLAWWRSGARTPAVVIGEPGSGKTVLLLALAEHVRAEQGPGAADVRSVIDSDFVIGDDLAHRLAFRDRGLIGLNDADTVPRRAVIELAESIAQIAPIGVILAAGSRPRDWPAHWTRLMVSPFNDREATELVGRLAPQLGGSDARLIVEASDGSPFLLSALANMARTEPVEQALARLRGQQLPTLFPAPALFPSPNLYPGQDPSEAASRALNVRVRDANDELIRELVERPELMYKLHARQFEELLAEVFKRHDFEVELTQQTHDGGVDLYLVKHTAIGTALTLVEAKRNRSDRPVGVEVIRRLYGVVEAKKANAGLVANHLVLHPRRQAVPARRRVPDGAQGLPRPANAAEGRGSPLTEVRAQGWCVMHSRLPLPGDRKSSSCRPLMPV